MRDIAGASPARDDSIYRIYSMSKTVTIVAAMTLYERGLFKLHDSIAEFLPAFSKMKVAVHDERGVRQLVPAKGPITFEHLFTMTSGLPYPGTDSFSAREMAKLQDEAAGGKDYHENWTTAQIVDAAAKTPLCFEPGQYWKYGFSHDVLGRLVEVISGKRFGAYLDETIFQPLGMTDTAFFVPPEKQGRLMKAYQWTAGGLFEVKGLNTDPGRTTPPAFESGGGGLASTIADVSAFARMLLGGGKLGGERILSRKTIDLIRRNHHLPGAFGFESMGGYGYGLGVRTLLDTCAAGINGSEGEWAWDGMLGTWYCVDPAEDMVAIFMTQRVPGATEDLPKRFMQTVYAAIET
jgi:CubicO group peptidase (beta-lactamase class C family)